MTSDLVQMRQDAVELIHQGHPRFGEKMMALIQRIEQLEAIPANQNARELARLRAVIECAIPYQTNLEVARWLREAMTPGWPIYRGDGTPIVT